MWSKLASGFVVSDVSWEGLYCRPILALPVIGLPLSGRSLKALCDWLLPVLNLEVCGGGLAVY